MRIENIRDAVYTFSSLETLKKFLWETIGHDYFMDEKDYWISGGRYNIRSKTIRDIKKRTE